DIFPQELGGGVFYDMTRTYWIGEVPETVTKAYRAVEEAFEKTAAEARAGQPTRDLDALCCDVLEGHGYVTKRTDPKTEVGYMHSLGHGVGLEIHERPWVSTRKVNQDVFEVGQVFTIEPGLYYPDEGFGMRIEDTFVIEPGGRAQTLSALPRNPRITL
ncbi:MAG: M24 family metallopeptidase, partial [Planctomycetota bacterium]